MDIFHQTAPGVDSSWQAQVSAHYSVLWQDMMMLEKSNGWKKKTRDSVPLVEIWGPCDMFGLYLKTSDDMLLKKLTPGLGNEPIQPSLILASFFRGQRKSFDWNHKASA